MTTQIPPSLERFGAELDRAAHRELSGPSERARVRRPRPRLLAGGTLGLAGIGAALVLILSAGGAAAPPAFAITTNGDGSLTVNLDTPSTSTIQLFFTQSVMTGMVWFTKIVTDPFHDVKLYFRAPLYVLRGERIDPMEDVAHHA